MTLPQHDFYVARAMAMEHGQHVFICVVVENETPEAVQRAIKNKYPEATAIGKIEVVGYCR